MVRHKTLKDKDIEELLAHLEGGEISVDDAESEGDDLEFYPSLEELQAILEDEDTEEEPTGMPEEENFMEEPGSAENFPDPPLINENTPSTSDSAGEKLLCHFVKTKFNFMELLITHKI